MAATVVDMWALNETVHNILIYFGMSSDVPNYAVFQVPRPPHKPNSECDLCFPIVIKNWPVVEVPACFLYPEFSKFRLSINHEQILENLPALSQEWPLSIKSYKVSDLCICLMFDKAKAFKNIIHEILETGSSYGRITINEKFIYLSSDCKNDNEDFSLLQLRSNLAACALSNILRTVGYQVENYENECMSNNTAMKYHIGNRSKPNSCLIRCGNVFDFSTGIKDTGLRTMEYYKRKEEEMKILARNKTEYSETEVDVECENLLARAEAITELLSVKLHDNVQLILHEQGNGDHKGAFMLYNHVRISCIRRKFEEQVKNGVYPFLPVLREIDFSLLTDEEEWELLKLLLNFQFSLFACINGLEKGKASPHSLITYLDKLCRKFSVYYRRVRILTPHRDHLLPTMFARLYLLQAIEITLCNGFRLLGIETPNNM